MRWTKIAALAAAGALSLAACGGSSSTTTPTSAGASGSATSTAPTTSGGGETTSAPVTSEPTGEETEGFAPELTGPAPAVEGAKTGGTLTYVTAGSPSSMDPSAQYYQDTNAFLNLNVRRLTTFAMKDGKWVLAPDLAADLGTVSDDGLTWTFKLKEGIKYEDGSPVTAKDFVYGVKRSFAQEELPGGPTFQNDYLVDGDKYKGPYADKGEFKGVEAPDDTTLVFHLRKKWPTLPYFGTFTQISPIPEAKDTKTDYEAKPIGTGPYKVESYKPGESLVFVKNENWDPNTDPARYQFVDKYVFKFQGDWNKNVEAIFASSSDEDATSITADGVPAELLEQALGEKSAQIVNATGPCVSYVNMDTRKIPKEVRKAIAVAYPFDQIRQAVGLTSLDEEPATTIMAKSVPGFAAYPPVEDLNGKGKGDPERAKQMLEQAGKLGFELVYYFSDSPTATAANGVRRPALVNAGFKVKDIQIPRAEIRDYRNKVDSEANLLQGPAGWCYDWPSGDSIFPPLFSTVAQKSGHSAGFLSDPALDAEIERIQELSIPEQGPEWGKLDQKILTDYLPLLPDSYSKLTAAFGSKVHNVQVNPHIGMPAFEMIWVG